MLKRTRVVQILIVLLIQFILAATTIGDSINMTGAEQSVGGLIAYQYPEEQTNNIVEYKIVPDPPQGLGNADYDITLNHYGVSVFASLNSTFSEDQVTAEGFSNTSAYWGDQPWFDGDDANDVHGGAGPAFRLYFTEGVSPVHVSISGQLQVNIDGCLNLSTEETYAFVKLLSDGGGVIWETSLYGAGAQSFQYDLYLESGQNYQLYAHATSNTTAYDGAPELHSRTASFSLTATADIVSILPDVLLKEYVPLKEGITWNYLHTYADGHKDYEVFCIGGAERINDAVMHKRWQFDSGELYDHDYSYESLSWTQEGLKLYKIVYSNGSYFTCDPPAIEAPASIRIGETFKHSCTMTEYDADGNVINSWPYGRELTLDGVEDIEVLAGSFTQCLKFSGKFTEKENESQVTIWLAPGIGPVKTIFPENEQSELISLTIQGKTYCPAD